MREQDDRPRLGSRALQVGRAALESEGPLSQAPASPGRLRRLGWSPHAAWQMSPQASRATGYWFASGWLRALPQLLCPGLAFPLPQGRPPPRVLWELSRLGPSIPRARCGSRGSEARDSGHSSNHLRLWQVVCQSCPCNVPCALLERPRSSQGGSRPLPLNLRACGRHHHDHELRDLGQ